MIRLFARIIAASLVLLLVSLSAQAQCVRFLDSQSMEPLIGVTVVLADNTSEGDISNADGQLCHAEWVGTKCRASFVGFEPLEFDFPSQNIDLTLAPQARNSVQGVVISATRSGIAAEEAPISISKLNLNVIANSNAADLEEAMEKVPGVSMVNGQANIRGSSGFSYGIGTRVLALLDGLPVLSADAADIKWNFMPLEQLADIEVIKGPASALYGSAALGGVINLIPKMPATKFGVQARTYQEIYGSPPKRANQYWTGTGPKHYGLFAAVDLPSKKLLTNVSLSAVSDDGWRLGESSRRMRAGLDLVPRLKNTRLFARLRVTAMIDSGQNFLFWKGPNEELTPAPATSSPQTNSRLLIDPTVTYSLSSKTILRAKARHYTTDNQIATGQSSLGVNQLLELSVTRTQSKNLDYTLGVLGLRNDVYSDSIYGRHYSVNYAAFGQVNYRYNKTFISLGLRAETYKTDERETVSYLVGRLGVNQRVGKATFFRASVGQGFRNPSIGELFVKTSASVLRVFPNPDLSPEKGLGYELGVRQLYQKGKAQHSLDLAGYANFFDNFSEFTFGVWLPPGVPPIQSINYLGFKSINSDRARLAGIEVEYLFRYQASEKRRIELQTGYTYTSATAENENGDRVNLRFRYAHLVKLNAQYVGGKVEAGLFARYNSRMLADDPTLLILVPGSEEYRISRPDGDLILDARIGYNVRKWLVLSFVVKNLANQGYMVIPGNLGQQRSFIFQQSFRF